MTNHSVLSASLGSTFKILMVTAPLVERIVGKANILQGVRELIKENVKRALTVNSMNGTGNMYTNVRPVQMVKQIRQQKHRAKRALLGG